MNRREFDNIYDLGFSYTTIMGPPSTTQDLFLCPMLQLTVGLF